MDRVDPAAAFAALAARDPFVRANSGRWRPDAVVEQGESTVLRVPRRGGGAMLVGCGEVGEVAELVRDHDFGDVRFALMPYGLLEARPKAMAESLRLEPVGPWEWLYCRTPPPLQPGEEWVVPLGHVSADQISEVIHVANPSTHARADDPSLTWWGYERDGALLGVCGLTLPPDGLERENGVHLSGLGVHPDVRRRGVGAAIMAAITRWGIERYGLVHCGVWMDNHAALRSYRRLGYTTGAWVQNYHRS